MERRRFLEIAGMAGLSTACEPLRSLASAKKSTPHPEFPDADAKWRRTWDSALTTLGKNIRLLSTYRSPVLIEGAEYPGIWLECSPMESLVYAKLAEFVPQRDGQPSPAEIALANHMAFFALQREDGQLPAYIWKKEIGYSQIQMEVPIAATSWELVRLTKNEQLLKTAYASYGRWDAWLMRYRNTRKTGLVEGFCTYDTGMDNSPRWAGIPNSCPDNDARKCPPLASLPRLCPDLSATVYGGRIAMAAMANELGLKDEASRWLEDAERIRKLILEKLYCPEDASFYDLDAQGKFVRIRCDLITRVLGEHVLKSEIASDRRIFDDIWTRQLHNPKAFWTPFPWSSVAIDDPLFVRPIQPDSWGGPSQALTALRATRWVDYYGKQQEFDHVMRQWVTAIYGSGKLAGEFYEQIDPMTGEYTRTSTSDFEIKKGYTPTALAYLEFIRRLQSPVR
jgi:hypothetical protein